MKNKYPAYCVFAAWTKELFRYFPKSREGLEQAIEYAENNHCYYVYCVKGPLEKPELVWEGYPKSFGRAMMKAAKKNTIITIGD